MKIKKLTLATSHLTDQIDFYHNTLKFKILAQGHKFVEFETGDSILRFEEKETSAPYHFAFNIPSYQETEALEWLEERVNIVPYETEKIIPFNNWNAKAMYFHDKDHNIVEFIARKNLDIHTDQPFSSQSILEISEMGVPVIDISPIYYQLNSNVKLETYSGSIDRFCAIGDENGLFIIINKHKKPRWFPSDDIAFSSDFKAIVSNEGKPYSIIFREEKIYTHELKSNHNSFHQFA
jgi:hypothetical protein